MSGVLGVCVLLLLFSIGEGYLYLPSIYRYVLPLIYLLYIGMCACLYTYYIRVGGYLYIPTIYVYVHMIIYILYICMCICLPLVYP